MEKNIEKTLRAGEILRDVVEKAAGIIKPGVKLLKVAEFVENGIRDKGALPAFPCNISINSDAAHFTPKKGDEREFQKGDVVKLDAGAHIDGYIADMAITVDLGNNSDLVNAAKEALKAAIEVVKAGVSTKRIGETIENVIKEFGFKPVVNLTGHGLLPYIAHAPPSIYNYAVKKGVELREGMIIAIEPFATDGEGIVVERKECEIYSLINPKLVRMKPAREIIAFASERYRTLPFAKRWLPKAPEVILSKMVRDEILRSYPVLTEVSGGLVSQWEHTLIVEGDGAKIVTGELNF